MDLLTQNYLTRGFWGDEAWTALISQLPISEIIRVTGEDFHPPFYYFIVHFWGNLFGFGEITIRLVSLLFFLATPVAAFFLAKHFDELYKNSKDRSSPAQVSGSPEFDRRTSQENLAGFTRPSFWRKSENLAGFYQNLFPASVALLVLLSPILFTYAFEARAYALLAFLSITSALAFWKARTEKGYRWRLLYFLIGSVSVYTHYYAWFILASHGLYLLLFERKYFLRLLPPAIGILIVQLPWIPTLLSQVGEVNRDYWIAPINHRTHWEFFLRVTGGDHTTRYQLPSALLIILSSLAYLLTQLKQKFSSKESKFLLSWLIIPTLIPTLISLTFTPIFFYRYLIFSSIPLLIIFTIGLTKLPKAISLSAIGLLALLYLTINYSSFTRHPRSMREVAEEVYQTKTPGDSPIYTVLPSFAETYYYAGQTDQIKVLDEGIVQFSGKSLLDSFVRQGLVEIVPAPKNPYWLLSPGPQSNFVDSSKLQP